MNKKFTFYVEVTTACNLKCPFCPSSNKINHKYIDFNDFILIINKIKDYCNLIYFHILGEPTLHSNLIDMFRHCEKLGLDFALTTNGININEMCDDIFKFKHFKKINISLQSLIQFKDDTRKKYLENLKKFILKRNNYNSALPLVLRLWNDKTKEDVTKLNDYILKTLYEYQENKNIVIQEADEFQWPNLNLPYNNHKSGCLGAKKQFGILNDGTITICCLDYLGNTKLGNILNDSFYDIINSDLYEKIINGFNNKEPFLELCKKCTYRNRF